MVKLIDKKIRGSTIIEVLVAMVIIMIVFTIAMMIFGNVMKSGISFKKIQAQQQLNILARTVQESGFSANSDIQIDNIRYQFKTDTTSLIGYAKLSIQAYQHHQLLGQINCYYQMRNQYFEN